jgi:glycine cleavage system regulatory protein
MSPADDRVGLLLLAQMLRASARVHRNDHNVNTAAWVSVAISLEQLDTELKALTDDLALDTAIQQAIRKVRE